MKLLIPTVLAALFGLSALGCGGSDSDQKSQTQQPKPASTVANPPGQKGQKPSTKRPRSGTTSSGSTRGGTTRGTTPSGSSRPSKQLVTQAQGKCKQRASAVEHTQEKLDRATATLRPDTFGEAARTADQVGAAIKAQMGDLQALQVSGQDKRTIQKLLRSYEDQIAILARIKRALQRRSIGGLQELQRQAFAQRISTQALARSLGIAACGLAS